jgi:hypothetical protein
LPNRRSAVSGSVSARSTFSKRTLLESPSTSIAHDADGPR